MGNVTLAMLDSVVMEAAGRWLAEAERGVMRARDLTQQLLTFAKGGEPVRKAVQLPEVVREAAEFALHGSKVRCEFDNETDLWPADVDKGQIGQVVQNLVINAVQAMPEGGFVRIQLRNERVTAESTRPLTVGDYVYLCFRDTGTGIRAEHLSRIFDPYFTTKQSGSGLGLATVYSIIRKHQGHIEVESELGKGTTFHILLPAAAVTQVETKETPDSIAPISGRVLFMDDEETIRMLAVSLLTRVGLEVTAVPDGGKAIEQYVQARDAGRPFRLVIMDLTVPGGMGGLEAMQKLLELDPNVKAIVSSGYSSDPVLANYRSHGFRGVVPKPYRFAELARTIRTVIEEP
jgi:CheY-like chemotaxis protein/two-component sensor histidine kinase